MNEYKSDFAENLIFYRTQKNMSQLELSGICECGKSTIGGLESGKTYPSYGLILKIADALEIHPADLFLRNASKTREEVRNFFDNELSSAMKEMVEKKFPVVPRNEEE